MVGVVGTVDGTQFGQIGGQLEAVGEVLDGWPVDAAVDVVVEVAVDVGVDADGTAVGTTVGTAGTGMLVGRIVEASACTLRVRTGCTSAIVRGTDIGTGVVVLQNQIRI